MDAFIILNSKYNIDWDDFLHYWLLGELYIWAAPIINVGPISRPLDSPGYYPTFSWYWRESISLFHAFELCMTLLIAHGTTNHHTKSNIESSSTLHGHILQLCIAKEEKRKKSFRCQQRDISWHKNQVDSVFA